MKATVTLSLRQKKQAEAVYKDIAAMIAIYGINRLVFITLVFDRSVTTVKEAMKRLKSARTRLFPELFVEFIRFIEPHRDGRPHFHIIAITHLDDIRTGFNFEPYRRAIAKGISLRMKKKYYALAVKNCPNMATLSRTLQERLPGYGFGPELSHDIAPIFEAAAAARYVAGYVGKGIGSRTREWKRVRLIGYSKGARRNSYLWSHVGGAEWCRRAKWKKLQALLGFEDQSEFVLAFGRRFQDELREVIKKVKLNYYPTAKEANADRENGLDRFPDSAVNIEISCTDSIADYLPLLEPYFLSSYLAHSQELQYMKSSLKQIYNS